MPSFLTHRVNEALRYAIGDLPVHPFLLEYIAGTLFLFIILI